MTFRLVPKLRNEENVQVSLDKNRGVGHASTAALLSSLALIVLLCDVTSTHS